MSFMERYRKIVTPERVKTIRRIGDQINRNSERMMGNTVKSTPKQTTVKKAPKKPPMTIKHMGYKYRRQDKKPK